MNTNTTKSRLASGKYVSSLKTLLVISVIGFTLAGLLGASALGATRNVCFRDIRAIGMGGAGITAMDGFTALMYNPALLSRAETSVDVITIQANASKDVFDLLSFINDNEEIIDNFTDTVRFSDADRDRFMDDAAEFDNDLVGAGACPKVGLAMKNWAAGAYLVSDAAVKLDLGIFEPRVLITGDADLVFTGGYGTKLPKDWISFLPNDLHVGGALKIINRRTIYFESMASDTDFDNILDSLKENAETETGFGVDLGFLYELKPGKVDVGMKVVDLLSSVGGETPPIVVNIGGSYYITETIIVAADYNDLFRTRGVNVFNNFYFGGEARFVNDIFAVRAGFGQGYPAIGAGIDLNVVRLDGAIYGVERTCAPGGESETNYALRLKIGM